MSIFDQITGRLLTSFIRKLISADDGSFMAEELLSGFLVGNIMAGEYDPKRSFWRNQTSLFARTANMNFLQGGIKAVVNIGKALYAIDDYADGLTSDEIIRLHPRGEEYLNKKNEMSYSERLSFIDDNLIPEVVGSQISPFLGKLMSPRQWSEMEPLVFVGYMSKEELIGLGNAQAAVLLREAVIANSFKDFQINDPNLAKKIRQDLVNENLKTVALNFAIVMRIGHNEAIPLNEAFTYENLLQVYKSQMEVGTLTQIYDDYKDVIVDARDMLSIGKVFSNYFLNKFYQNDIQPDEFVDAIDALLKSNACLTRTENGEFEIANTVSVSQLLSVLHINSYERLSFENDEDILRDINKFINMSGVLGRDGNGLTTVSIPDLNTYYGDLIECVELELFAKELQDFLRTGDYINAFDGNVALDSQNIRPYLSSVLTNEASVLERAAGILMTEFNVVKEKFSQYSFTSQQVLRGLYNAAESVPLRSAHHSSHVTRTEEIHYEMRSLQ